jgi:hypothetical protein
MFAVMAVAWAGETLVHAPGELAAATAGLARVGGGDGEVRVVTLAQLLSGGQPSAVAGAVLVPCAGGPQSAVDVDNRAVKAARAIAYMDAADAEAQLAAADAGLACLDAPVPPALGARVHFLRGILAFDRGDVAGAATHFARARTFWPEMKWDPNYPPDARAVFEGAAPPEAALWLRLVPPPASGKLWVDGREVPVAEAGVALAPGPHVVQLDDGGLATFAVDVQGPAGALVRPAATPPDALTWLRDPTLRPALSSVLAATIAPEETVYVADDGRLWRVHAGRDDWEELAEAAVPARVARTRRVVGGTLLGAGGAALVGGSLLAATSWAGVGEARDAAASAATREAYEDASARYDRTLGTVRAGGALGVGGAVLLVSGAVVAF